MTPLSHSRSLQPRSGEGTLSGLSAVRENSGKTDTGAASGRDGEAAEAPFRGPGYAPRTLGVERLENGGWLLSNPRPFSRDWLTTNAALDAWAIRAPARIWLAERSAPSPSGLTRGWREVAYAEAAERVAALASGLRDLELGPDKPLLILARNGIDHALIAYAAMRIGAPVAAVSPQYGLPGARPERLAHAVGLIRPGAVYVDDWGAFGDAVMRDAGLSGAAKIASVNASGPARDLRSLERGSAAPDLARGDQTAKLLLTSGSTGLPKAVICTHANVSLNAAQIDACFENDAGDGPEVVVNAAPWSHSLGSTAILHRVLHRGGTLYIDAGQPTPERFGETLRNLSDVSPTYHNMVPAGWALLADALERDDALARTVFARVRVVQYGGASMPQSVCDRIEAVAVRTIGERVSFATGYGSTETGPTACNIHWPNARSGLIGLPVPGTALKLAPIVDGAGEGGRYEIRVKGPQISPGYRDGEGRVVPLDLDEDGFYRLGDAARLVDDRDPSAGMTFDGRLVESFKLASGTFVAAGALRVAVLSALGGLATDAVLCGEGRDGVGLLLFVNPEACAALSGAGEDRAVLARDATVQAVCRERLLAYNDRVAGGAGRIVRALILTDAPDPHSGELTDKGYINQALARDRRAPEVARLFADEPDAAVLVL